MTRIAALVLAGGRATRMGGGDKPLLDLGGRPILARVLAALAPGTAAAAISANGDPARFARFDLPVLDDGPFAGEGPLAGVRAGLAWAETLGAEWLLTAPGDAPFLPRGLAVALSPGPSFAACAGRDHPLVALWPVAARPALEAKLRGPGSRAVIRFTAELGARRVAFASAPRDPFHNVNTLEDLTAARVLLGETPC